jgi:hypothetical protein
MMGKVPPVEVLEIEVIEPSRQAAAIGLESDGGSNKGKGFGAYGAALKLTSPWFPIMAVIITALTYLLPDALLDKLTKLETGLTGLPINHGVLASIVGLVLALGFWAAISYYPARKRVTVEESTPPNYHQITEALDSLKYKIKNLCPDGNAETPVDNGIDGLSRREACAEVKGDIEEIEKRLQDGGMDWVTGAGYIELWHRIHRAQEAMIKLEPVTEVAEEAMRDEERLRDANMENRDRLLDHLRSSVAVLETPEANGYLRYVPKCKNHDDISNDDIGKFGVLYGDAKKNFLVEEITKIGHMKARKKAEARKKLYPEAIAILAETRYEINRFRDNSWEGIVNARNHLLDTSMNLGLMTFALLAFTLMMHPDQKTIYWAAIYFLVGAVTALFARARIEWSAASAVDDFGLTRARLVHLPWLAGLAAVGGVLVTAVLGPQLAAAGGTAAVSTISEALPKTVADVFNGGNITLLIVAAVFGLTPDLIIRRLEQQTEKYKADLESTQSTQSTESGVKNETSPTNKKTA